MEIRELKKEDIETIVEIYEQHHKEDAKIIKKIYTKYYNSKQKKDTKNIKDYVLIENNQIIAFSGYNKETTETKDIYWLNWTGVRNEFQNKGYGTILLKYIFTKLREIGARKIYVSTSTQKEYKNAIKFYTKRGFEIEGKLKNYYKQGIDMIMLGKELNKSKNPIEKLIDKGNSIIKRKK